MHRSTWKQRLQNYDPLLWGAILAGATILFQPYQFNAYPIESKAEVASVIAVLAMLGALLVRNITRRSNFWLKMVGLLVFVSVGLFVFKVSAGYYPLNWERLGTGLLAMMALTAIPFALMIRRQRAADGLHEVAYIEAQGNYLHLYTANGSLIKRERATLTSMETKGFVRCHKGFVVRLDRVKEITREKSNYFARLDTGQQIPIGRTRLQMIRSTLADRP